MEKTLMLVSLIAVCGATLYAQQAGNAAPNPSGLDEPTQIVPNTLQKIYSNLSSSPAYDKTAWWDVLGPLNSVGTPPQSIAMPFTPKSDSHVSQVQAALKWKSGGNQVSLGLFGDAGGVPGNQLAGPVTVTNLPAEGTCCGVAKANFTTSVAVTAGTQYWVVAVAGSADFTGAWDWVITKNVFAYYQIGWLSQQVATQTPAGAVYGTIP
jgi:hypothetical protein